MKKARSAPPKARARARSFSGVSSTAWSRPAASSMHAEALKTPRVEPGDSLEEILDRCVPALRERSVVAVTSKIVSLCQNRVVAKSASVRKEDLIRREADAVADAPDHPYGLYITIKDNILTPSAGIDESNADGVYVLYPDDVQGAA